METLRKDGGGRSMTTKKKKRWVVMGVLCAAALTLLVWRGADQPEPGQWRSLPLYGSSLCTRQQGVPFTVTLVATRDSGWDGTAASFYAAFDVPWASLKDCTLTKQFSAEGYDLFQIYGTVAITGDPGEAESFRLQELTVNGRTIPGVEELVFEVEQEGNDRFASLELRSCAVVSASPELHDYTATFRNSAGVPITITAVEAACYPEAAGAVVRDGEVLNLRDSTVEVAPGQEVEVRVRFEQMEWEELTSYFAAPVVRYRENGQERSIQLQTYQTGLAVSEKNIQQVGEALFAVQD